MNREQIVETMAKRIYDTLEGPVANQDFTRQLKQWHRAMEIADSVLSDLEATGMAIVPTKPTEILLKSMAVRYDHGLGMPGYYDQELIASEGVTHARRLESTMITMRQLHEEVVGTGFYRADRGAAKATGKA
jgi:hypothetical protein